jgi:RNA polymerase sigma factor (sigma-70 family)
MKEKELIPHLFRTEYSRIVAVLCKRFGFDQIEAAEDIASEAFLAALNTWTYNGIPENPAAWLYTVAKNKAANYFERENVFKDRIVPEIATTSANRVEVVIDLSERNIADSQLQMLFAICHPALPAESQIGLALRILCGFGIDEIANAFLTNKETINKRLLRAKEKLRTEKIEIVFPDEDEILRRLEQVMTTLYLLFNEGYYSESQDSIVREDLCLEAMRLTHLLLDYEATNLPQVNALMALMCFHASRLEARKNPEGKIILYEDQDQTLWNQELIRKGAYYLKKASEGKTISKYHLEASIAYWHTVNSDIEKWENILHLYNQLLVLEYSPLAALNRTIAVAKVKGNPEAIAEAEKLKLVNNHFYYVLLGELYRELDPGKSKINFEKAYTLASTNPERLLIREKLESLGKPPVHTVQGKSIKD